MGFAAAIVVGLASRLSPETILVRAIVTMPVCWVVGRLVGEAAQRAVDEHVQRYKAEHPIPSLEPSTAAHSAGTDEQEIEAYPAADAVGPTPRHQQAA